jgi:hydrogenase maturation protease
MENLIGYEHAILIDAMNTGEVPQGTVTHLQLDDLPNIAIGHLSSAHDTTLKNAIQVGRSVGAEIPEKIEIVAIEAAQVYDFSDKLSPEVAAALPEAIDKVMELLP